MTLHVMIFLLSNLAMQTHLCTNNDLLCDLACLSLIALCVTTRAGQHTELIHESSM